MGVILGSVLLFLGWIGIISATFVWGGYGVYQLVKTDISFFSVVLPCLGYWVLQMIVSWLSVIFGAIVAQTS